MSPSIGKQPKKAKNASNCRKFLIHPHYLPARGVFVRRLKRAIFMAHIWSSACVRIIQKWDPVNHGWKVVEGKLVLLWCETELIPEDLYYQDNGEACDGM